MEVLVDTRGGRVWLEQWDDFGSLSVMVRMVRSGDEGDRPVAALVDALGADGSGRLDPDGDIHLTPDGLAALATRAATEAGTELGPDWRTSFEAMLDRAAVHGWIDDDGAVRAHLEWKET